MQRGQRDEQEVRKGDAGQRDDEIELAGLGAETGGDDRHQPRHENFAEQHKANLFVSLHFNSSAPNQEQTGLETYCLTPPGLASSMTRGYGDDVALTFANTGRAEPTTRPPSSRRIRPAPSSASSKSDRRTELMPVAAAS